MAEQKLTRIMAAAKVYGERSFDNYVQVRSVAENIRDGFCEWLDNERQCVFLVPPQGAFTAQNYRSAAYSVSGKGFLPLEPISFGLAIRISDKDDFMRLVVICRKEGHTMFVQVENSRTYELSLPVVPDKLTPVYESLFEYLLGWFEDRVEQYDHGNYGSMDIGFDIQRVET